MEKVLCVVLVLLTYTWANSEHYPIVTTSYGGLRGSILTSRLGKRIFSFRGVRFAQPPIGDLRFKAPVPLEPWNGVVDATEDGASCPPSEGGEKFNKSEDCLFLNVYTTKLPTHAENPKRPVIVFFHPGGWFSFTGNSRMFGPQYLLDQDIVLVTTNYRLGALDRDGCELQFFKDIHRLHHQGNVAVHIHFNLAGGPRTIPGFLSTQDEVLPGNYAMKDQVAALRWVRDNIAAFGGDPECVTITGYSAGGTSVMLHMVSPMSRGLFHRVIASSGSALSQWTIQESPITRAKLQAEMFGCPSGTSQEIKDCLMQIDAQELVSSPAAKYTWGFDPLIRYAPVIEANTGEERFLVNDPIQDFIAGNFVQTNFMTGITRDEFAWKTLQIYRNQSWLEDLNTNFDQVAPIIFMYEKDTESSLVKSRKLRNLYFQDKPIDNSTKEELGKLYRDGIIAFGEDRASKVISRVSSAPLYYYRFSYQGRYSYIYKPGTDIPFGVDHHDDLICLFYTSVLFPFFNSTDPEVECVERLTTLWANFARTGNPTPKQDALLQNVIWEPLTPSNLKYLDIGSDLQMKAGLYQDTLAAWEQMFPLPGDGHST